MEQVIWEGGTARGTSMEAICLAILSVNEAAY